MALSRDTSLTYLTFLHMCDAIQSIKKQTYPTILYLDKVFIIAVVVTSRKMAILVLWKT